MDISFEYSPSNRASCKRCQGKIEKGALRIVQYVESSYGYETTQYRHYGCATPDMVRRFGVNNSSFHSLTPEDQKRVVNAITLKRIPASDISEALRPPPQIPIDLTVSPNAKKTETKSWPPSKTGSSSSSSAAPGSSGAFAERQSSANKRKMTGKDDSNAPASSGATGSTTLVASSPAVSSSIAPSSSSSAFPPSSSSQVGLPPSSLMSTTIGTPVPSSSQTSFPPSQPGEVADGRLVRAEDKADATQDDSEGEDNETQQEDDVFYLRYRTDVVGIQHYNGLVGPGEIVSLIRQPFNKYDSNAIQVKNMNDQQVGHIPRDVASRLAPLMDRRVIDVQGIMQDGNLDNFSRSKWKLKIMVDFYGPPSSREQLRSYMTFFGEISQTGLPPDYNMPGTQVHGAMGSSAGGSRGKGKSRAYEETGQEKEARRIMEGLASLDKGEGRTDTLLDDLTGGFDVLALPAHPEPPSRASGQLKSDLLPHQSQALLWMQERENPTLPEENGQPVQLWCRVGGGLPHWLNTATRTPQPITAPPLLGRGGIMADAMGLGKTLTVLALILAGKTETSDSQKKTAFCKTTLIVCPLSVLSNWEAQIEEHVQPGQLRFAVFHGDGRTMSQADLEKLDIVVTTYNVLSSEAGAGPAAKKKGKNKVAKLSDIKWKRIVLDEGHTIRNANTAMSRACIGLTGERRWVVSGTPIVNGAKDLGTILSFLKICKPLDEPEQFKKLVVRKLAGGAGASILQSIMTHSCLRRTKEMEDDQGRRLVPLPPVNFYMLKVDLHKEDREAYDMAMNASRQRFEEFIENERTGSLPPNVLQLITRLRQLALLSTLVPPNYIEDLTKEEQRHAEIDNLTAEARNQLLWKLKAAVDDNDECPVCFDTLANPRITMCGHSYCLDCILETIKLQAKCPMDRTPLPSDKYLLELPEVMPGQEGEDDFATPEPEDKLQESLLKSSAKIDELLKYLKAFPKGQKTLVFSQFTKFLTALEPHLRRAGINFVRFDGSMSAKQRAAVIEEFQRPVAGQDGSAEGGTATKDEAEYDSSATEEEDSDYDDEDESPIAPERRGKSKNKGKGKGKASATVKNGLGRKIGSQTRKGASPNAPTVMLISLKSGSVGINLTAAQNLFLCDPWWASAIEAQAIDRINRIGQKAKEVRVFQLIAKDTIEEKILEIQARKDALIQQAFAGIKRKETAREKKEARFNELRELFGVATEAGASSGASGSTSATRLTQTTL